MSECEENVSIVVRFLLVLAPIGPEAGGAAEGARVPPPALVKASLLADSAHEEPLSLLGQSPAAIAPTSRGALEGGPHVVADGPPAPSRPVEDEHEAGGVHER